MIRDHAEPSGVMAVGEALFAPSCCGESEFPVRRLLLPGSEKPEAGRFLIVDPFPQPPNRDAVPFEDVVESSLRALLWAGAGLPGAGRSH